MISASYKVKSFLLAITWLLVSTAWAPISALAHVGDGSHSMPSSLVKTIKVSGDSKCGAEGCQGAAVAQVDCNLACAFFTVSHPVNLSFLVSTDTFTTLDTAFLGYPDLARLERPPSSSI